jgi:hypothetical protein
MEFQPTPGTYAAVDPFKPSISFSIKKIPGFQRAPQDDTDLDSPPPPRVAISTRRHGSTRPLANTAVGPRYEAPPDAWIPTASSRIRLPPPHELRAPSFELPPGFVPLPDLWIPQASNSPIRLAKLERERDLSWRVEEDKERERESERERWNERDKEREANATIAAAAAAVEATRENASTPKPNADGPPFSPQPFQPIPYLTHVPTSRNAHACSRCPIGIDDAAEDNTCVLLELGAVY